MLRTPQKITDFIDRFTPTKRKKNPSENETAIKTENEVFHYTFSPGRGPFNEQLSTYTRTRNDGFDYKYDEKEKKIIARIDLNDTTPWKDEGRSLPQGVEEETDVLKKLWRELRGHEVKRGDQRNYPGYLHTEGLLSGPHGIGTQAHWLNEPFMTRTNFLKTGGRVQGELSVAGDSIRITTQATISDIFYSPERYMSLLENDYEYNAYLTPAESERILINDFLDTTLEAKFCCRYVIANVSCRPDIYDWRRRMDSIILGENIDNTNTNKGHSDPNVSVLDLTVLANQYSEKLASPPTVPLSRDTTRGGSINSRDTIASFVTISLEETSNKVTNIFPPVPASPPRFTDKHPDFSAFSSMNCLKASLLNDINDCVTLYSGTSNKGDTGVLIFESSSITITQRMAQYANRTLQNIRADLFLRKARLTFILSCLENADVTINSLTENLFSHMENKIGLCETLLNDLEHPLIDSKENNSWIGCVKTMRNDPDQFDQVKLKLVVHHLMEQASKKYEELKAFCAQARKNSPFEIWKAAQQLLRETNLVSQLEFLAKLTHNNDIQTLATQCFQHFNSSDNSKKEFEKALKEMAATFIQYPIICSIVNLVLVILKGTDALYRSDFLAPYTEKEIQESGNTDPFLMHTLNNILLPWQQLRVNLEQVKDLNIYYALFQASTSWDQALKTALESLIKTLSENTEHNIQEQKAQIQSLIENRLTPKQKIDLYHALLSYNNSMLHNYRQVLYQQIAKDSNLSNTLTAEAYMDEHYYRALSLPYALTAFDDVTSDKIERIKNNTPGGINSESYQKALFLRHFYVGALFNHYLKDSPQTSEPDRKFFYSKFSEAKGWITNFVLNENESKSCLNALVNINNCLSHVIQNEKTPVAYIKELEEALKNEALDQLGAFWPGFIRLCAWISSLANFSKKENKAIIHEKIQALLDKSPANISEALLIFMRDTWKLYHLYDGACNSAIDEWKNSEIISKEAIEALLQLGRKKNQSILEKTLWLNAALRFHRASKKSFQGNDEEHRKSRKMPASFDELVSSRSISPISPMSPTSPKERRSRIVLIFGLILTYPNLPLSQREAVQKCTQDIFKNSEIRELTLQNMLEKIGLEDDASERKYQIHSHIPGFVFSNEECEIFSKDNYAKTIKERLNRLASVEEALAIDQFFQQIKSGLENVKQLAENKKYLIFLPCLMGRLFVAFSIAYEYLSTTNQSISRKIAENSMACLNLIGEIAGLDTYNYNLYVQFKGTWQIIMNKVLEVATAAKSTDAVSLRYQIALYHLLLALDTYYDLAQTEFETSEAVTMLSALWRETTGYAIPKDAIKPLLFILAPELGHTNPKLSEKLNRLSEFLKNGVSEIGCFGHIFCIHAKNDVSISSSLSSGVLPLRVLKENGRLDNANYSVRIKNSLDQLSIDLAKVYYARQKSFENPICYPILFIYRPFLHSIMTHPSYAREVVRCIEVYEQNGDIVRRDCFVRDERALSLKGESLLLLLAARKVPADSQEINTVSLAYNICFNSSVKDSDLKERNFLPEFFDGVLQFIQDSMQLMIRLHAPLQPISSAFLAPSDIYYDPRTLLNCDEVALMGLFILGLIYQELEKLASSHSAKVSRWLFQLPNFFSHPENIKNLAKQDFSQVGLLPLSSNDSSNKGDAIVEALGQLNKDLEAPRAETKEPQQVYCHWFNERKKSISISVSTPSSSISPPLGISKSNSF